MRSSANRINATLFDLDDRDLPSGLTSNEAAVMQFIEDAAVEGRELDPNDEIAHQLGWSGTGTVRGVMLRLERKGFITIECFQRGRRVYVAAIEKWTASPPCTTPHWRMILDRSPATPSVPKHRLEQCPTIMEEISRQMRERCIPFVEAQLVLMAYGVQALGMERAHG